MTRKEDIEYMHLEQKVIEELLEAQLRIYIGKTTDINQSLCMHSAIVAREMAQKGVTVCRVCNKPLGDGMGRYNDHLILRHPECVQPICTDCAKNKPDAFHLAFKRGVKNMRDAKQRKVEP